MYHNIKVNVVGPMKSGKSQVVKIIEQATSGMGIVVTEQNAPSAATSRKNAEQTNQNEQTGGELAAAPLFCPDKAPEQQDSETAKPLISFQIGEVCGGVTAKAEKIAKLRAFFANS